jgi:hypothetical protein
MSKLMFNKILALERTDVKKPRQEAITSITDKLQPADIDSFKKIVHMCTKIRTESKANQIE